MVSPSHEQRSVFIPDFVDFTIGEDVVPTVPARRCIDRFLEFLVDGDSAVRTIIATVAAFDEDGISPAIVDFFRLVDASGVEELSEILGNLAGTVTLFSIEFNALLSLEMPIAIEAEEIGILIDAAGFAKGLGGIPAIGLCRFFYRRICIELPVLIRRIPCFRTVQQIVIICVVEQVVFQADTVHGFLQAARFVTSKSSQATRIKPVAGHK